MDEEFNDDQNEAREFEEIQPQEFKTQMFSDEEREAELQKIQNEQVRLNKKQKQLKQKLVKMWLDYSKKDIPVLEEKDKKILKEAEKFKKLRPDVDRVYALIGIIRVKITSKAMSASPILIYAGIGALLLFMLIAVISIFASIFGSLGGGANSVFGVTGDDFYGVRMVYRDDEKSNKNVVKNYVEMIKVAVDETKTIQTVTVDVDGSGEKTYTLTNVALNITLPDEEYDFNSFDETTFATTYPEVYEIVFEIAKQTYKSDNEDQDFAGTTLIECAEGTKYFGVSNTNDVATFVENKLFVEKNLLTFTATESGTAVTDADTISKIKDEIKVQAKNKFVAKYETSFSKRVAKLFVKDYILSSDDETVSNVSAEEYVALIFMPKTNVVFSKLSFSVTNTDVNDFSISVNGKELDQDGDNMGIEPGQQAYIFSTPFLFNLVANEFEDIDTNNLQALADGMSLFDIMTNEELDYEIYMSEYGDGTGTYWTIKSNGVVALVNNDTPFNLCEYETKWR